MTDKYIYLSHETKFQQFYRDCSLRKTFALYLKIFQ